MNRCKKMTVLSASLVLGLSGAALAQGTGMSGSMSGSMPGMMSSSMSGGMVDYHLLSNQAYDYVDLMQARARGLSEDQVATVAKISASTGVMFRDVVDQVLEGQTFAALADKFNLKLSDVLDVTDEKAKIASYKATYETTGSMAMKGMMGGMNGGMMGGASSGMMGGSMSGGMSNSSTMGTMGTTGTMGTDATGTGTTGTGTAGATGTTGTATQ